MKYNEKQKQKIPKNRKFVETETKREKKRGGFNGVFTFLPLLIFGIQVDKTDKTRLYLYR